MKESKFILLTKVRYIYGYAKHRKYQKKRRWIWEMTKEEAYPASVPQCSWESLKRLKVHELYTNSDS